MSEVMDRLAQEVTEMGTVVDSAVATIVGLAQQIRDNLEDPVALGAMADELDAKANLLASAIEENTTPAEEPPVE